MPEALVPCQYHVMPADGVPRVSVELPQFPEEVGLDGVAGRGLTVTVAEGAPALQHPVFMSKALR